MAAGDVFKVRIVWDNQDAPANTTSGFFIRQVGIVAPAFEDIAATVEAWWSTAGAGSSAQKVNHASSIHLIQVTMRRWDPLEPFEASQDYDVAGTASDVSAQPQDSILVSLRTGNIGRSYRGRMFLPPPGEVKLAGPGQLTEGVADDIATQFEDQLRGALDALDAPMTIWSPTLSLDTLVTVGKVDRYIRSQRRRQDNTPLYSTP